MNIYINNLLEEIDENTNLFDALKSKDIIEKNVIAVALNGEIVTQTKWKEILLNEDDKIIIIGAVAGG